MEFKRFSLPLFAVIIFLFSTTFLIYFIVATRGTFVITQDLDYFNLQAQAFLHGRLDLANPIFTDELSLYKGKWYLYYGPLPAIPLAISQAATNRIFIPTIYFNVLVASLNVCLVFLIVRQLRLDFFPRASVFVPIVASLLFAFGTVHFWLAVRSGLWFLAQTHSFFFNALGLYFVLRRNPSFLYYFLSVLFIAVNFFGRVYTVFLLSIPIVLFFFAQKKSLWSVTLKRLSILSMPVLFFMIVYLTYNFVRFENPLESGFSYQKFHPHYLSKYNAAGGWFHIRNIPENLWYLVMETPSLTLTPNGVKLIHNPEGNSIFYLTPPFLTIFLSQPLVRRGKRLIVQALPLSLWLGMILTLFPILLLSGTGWVQFGYRYSLDVTIPLLLLSLFGVQMRVKFLYGLAVLFAIFIQTLGALYA